MPLFLAFVLALNCFIQISIVETALKTAVMETTKQLAANMYPVEVVYNEVKRKAADSSAGAAVQQVIDQIRQSKEKWNDIEGTIGSYSALVPDSIMQWLEWETKVQEQKDAIGDVINSYLYKAFKPVVLHHANTRLLDAEQLEIVHMTFPQLGSRDKVYFGIEAEYSLKLPIPFFNKTVQIKKRAYERVWTGS